MSIVSSVANLLVVQDLFRVIVLPCKSAAFSKLIKWGSPEPCISRMLNHLKNIEKWPIISAEYDTIQSLYQILIADINVHIPDGAERFDDRDDLFSDLMYQIVEYESFRDKLKVILTEEIGLEVVSIENIAKGTSMSFLLSHCYIREKDYQSYKEKHYIEEIVSKSISGRRAVTLGLSGLFSHSCINCASFDVPEVVPSETDPLKTCFIYKARRDVGKNEPVTWYYGCDYDWLACRFQSVSCSIDRSIQVTDLLISRPISSFAIEESLLRVISEANFDFSNCPGESLLLVVSLYRISIHIPRRSSFRKLFEIELEKVLKAVYTEFAYFCVDLNEKTVESRLGSPNLSMQFMYGMVARYIDLLPINLRLSSKPRVFQNMFLRSCNSLMKSFMENHETFKKYIDDAIDDLHYTILYIQDFGSKDLHEFASVYTNFHLFEYLKVLCNIKKTFGDSKILNDLFQVILIKYEEKHEPILLKGHKETSEYQVSECFLNSLLYICSHHVLCETIYFSKKLDSPISNAIVTRLLHTICNTDSFWKAPDALGEALFSMKVIGIPLPEEAVKRLLALEACSCTGKLPVEVSISIERRDVHAFYTFCSALLMYLIP